MRLKSDVIVQNIDDTLFLVPVGAETFQGIARSNKTAAFILEMLKKETTKEEIVAEMSRVYDAPRETISKDVEGILNTLRGIHVLEE